MSDELTVEELRRKVIGAKSLLSRLENQRHEAGRSGADIKQLNALQDRVNSQREKFRELVRAFKQSQAKEQ